MTLLNKNGPILFLWLIMAPLAKATESPSIADFDSTRFDISQSEVVIDKQTGLMWQRCSLGQMWKDNNCSGIAESLKWEEGLKAADDNQLAGYHDWYVPSKEQLLTLIDKSKIEPTLNTALFPKAPLNRYWSTSDFYNPDPYNKATVNYVHAQIRAVGPSSIFSYFHVRLVRDID